MTNYGNHHYNYYESELLFLNLTDRGAYFNHNWPVSLQVSLRQRQMAVVDSYRDILLSEIRSFYTSMTGKKEKFFAPMAPLRMIHFRPGVGE